MSVSATKKITQAAVGVIQDSTGLVLLAERPEGKPWSGYWEFPGGKVEEMETPVAALHRELKEELDIEVTRCYPWLTRTFDYPAKYNAAGLEVSAAKTVKLYFFVVTAWLGSPTGLENQQLSWQHPAYLNVSPMLPANAPILQALKLSQYYAMTNLSELGEDVFFARLVHALDGGLRMLLVREHALSAEEFVAFSKRVMAAAASYQATVFIHMDVHIAQQLGAAGVHLSSQQLMQMREKPAGLLCGASCYNLAELAQAERFGLDYVMLYPVKATQSHVDAEVLGWDHFKTLVAGYSLPVYALGGMQYADLHDARSHGAHGITMQRACW